jgi:hypothetical protein
MYRFVFDPRRLAVIGVALLVLASGCSKPRGKVSGQVRLNGTPLPGGLLTFRPESPREHAVTTELDELVHGGRNRTSILGWN